MNTRQSERARRLRTLGAFTLIELLTVIAIVAILVAILFPVFGTVRENARQSNTISNLHSVYVACRQYYDDEGTFPPSLFGYAEVHDNNFNTTAMPPGINRIALPSDLTNPPPSGVTLTAMSQVTNKHPGTAFLSGYLYPEQVKAYTTFTNLDNTVTNTSTVTTAVYPPSSPISVQANNGTVLTAAPFTQVTWQYNEQPMTEGSSSCPVPNDPDVPDADSSIVAQYPTWSYTYANMPKLYYTMDSMDIGPMLDYEGNPVKDMNGNTVYELHYALDWTHQLGSNCDVYYDANIPFNGPETNGLGTPWVRQLKYKNPPQENTVITYITQHTATSGSPNVIALLLSGTVRKINYHQAYYNMSTPSGPQLPMNYQP